MTIVKSPNDSEEECVTTSSDNDEESAAASLSDIEADKWSSSCDGESDGAASPWQSCGGLTAAVLREVLSRLDGAGLARAGGVCRAWRAAAADPLLWRRLLLPLMAPGDDQQAQMAHLSESNAWRSEWVRAHAGWELRARLSAGRAPLAHVALSPCAARLALATDDAAVMIWERIDSSGERWRESCSRSMRARGWAGVARAQWAPPGCVAAPSGASGRSVGPEPPRLLLAGPLAVGNRWELIVLQEQVPEMAGTEAAVAESSWSVSARAGCSGGAAGCWVGADAFLALELRRYAPFQCATTVWLNAATQETQSEYAGVTAPLLRVYNEGAASITHVAVAEAPLLSERSSGDCNQQHVLGKTGHAEVGTLQTLITGFSGAQGVLRAWGMRALRPPPLLASGDLRTRALARRASRALPGPEPERELDEAAVRALCTSHDYESRLPAALEGLLVQTDGRCVWACMSGGRVRCASLPELHALRELRAPHEPAAPGANDLHYVQPDLGDYYIVTPLGRRSGTVAAWTRASGAALTPLHHAAPALVTALPAPQVLLVLAADTLYLVPAATTILFLGIRYTTGTGSHMALRIALEALPGLRRAACVRTLGTLRNSCDGAAPPPCEPCEAPPRPPCRERPSTHARATRRVCCPPPPGHPPPCPPPLCPTVLCCSNPSKTKKRLEPKATSACGERDGVTIRLELAKKARQREYEREANARVPCQGSPPSPVPYSLGTERQCYHGTDGRQYSLPCDRITPPPCGPNRTPPPDRCVEILRDSECTIRDKHNLDPCAHVPPTLLEINRSGSSHRCNNNTSSRKFTSRIMESLSLSRASKGSCPRNSCNEKCETTGAKRAGDSGWCKTLPSPPTVPPPCREPTTLEKLKPRGPGRCLEIKETNKRGFHSSAIVHKSTSPNHKDQQKAPSSSAPPSEATEKLKKVLKERDELHEAGRGRNAISGQNCKESSSAPAFGSLDIPVPPGAANVRVRVSLDGGRSDHNTGCMPVNVTNCTSNSKGKEESWLSIKSLQKKLANCRKVDMAKKTKKDSEACPQLSTSSLCTPPKHTMPSPPCATIKKPAKPLPSAAPKQPSISSPCAPSKQPVSPSPCAPSKGPTSPSPCTPPKRPASSTSSPAKCPPKNVQRFSVPTADIQIHPDEITIR